MCCADVLEIHQASSFHRENKLHCPLDEAWWLYCKWDPAPAANLLPVIKECLLKQKAVRAFHYIGIAKRGKSQITYGRETVLLQQ